MYDEECKKIDQKLDAVLKTLETISTQLSRGLEDNSRIILENTKAIHDVKMGVLDMVGLAISNSEVTRYHPQKK